MKRILLEQEDFEKLTRGEIIQKDDTQIALSDIGYFNMIHIIEDNLVGSEEEAELMKRLQIKDPDNASFLKKLKEKLRNTK